MIARVQSSVSVDKLRLAIPCSHVVANSKLPSMAATPSMQLTRWQLEQDSLPTAHVRSRNPDSVTLEPRAPLISFLASDDAISRDEKAQSLRNAQRVSAVVARPDAVAYMSSINTIERLGHRRIKLPSEASSKLRACFSNDDALEWDAYPFCAKFTT